MATRLGVRARLASGASRSRAACSLPARRAPHLRRISESFLYADLIAGEEPDVEKAVEIFKLLLE
ncbi:MAG: QsdR family transcriptional regulator [Vicinamibacterales bacterium]